MFNCLFCQVLRYCQNGEPLWVSDEGKPNDGDIPKCECGSKRVFEFQVSLNKRLSLNCVFWVCHNTAIIKLTYSK